jgi:hypothetical protein
VTFYARTAAASLRLPGGWRRRHAGLADRSELDLGYRFVIGRHN